MGRLGLKFGTPRGEVKTFVFVSKLALNEMHKLDEAGGAPIDFETMKLQRTLPPGRMGKVLNSLFNLAPTLGQIGMALRYGAQKLRACLSPRAIARGLQRLRKRKPAETGTVEKILNKRLERERQLDQSEQRKIDALSPKAAFALALDRIHEWQMQALLLVTIPCLTSNLGVVISVAQNNNLSILGDGVAPLVGLLNAGAITTAAIVSRRFNALNVAQAGFNKLGQESFEQFVDNTHRHIENTRTTPLAWVKNRLNGNRHE